MLSGSGVGRTSDTARVGVSAFCNCRSSTIGGEQQRVQVRDPERLESGLLQALPDVWRREPVLYVDGAIVRSSCYRHRRFPERQHAARGERGGDAREHRRKLVAAQVRRHVEERGQIDRRRRCIKIQHVAQAAFQPSAPGVVDAQRVEVDAPGRPQPGQLGQVAAGSAANVQDAERPATADVRQQQGQADLPGAHVPPVGRLDRGHLVDFVGVHWAGPPSGASLKQTGIITRHDATGEPATRDRRPPLYDRAVRPHSRWVRRGTWSAALRAGLVLAGGAVVVRAVAARLPGLNPSSLWHDDLVYGSIIRSERFLDMVTAPIHVAPGPLVVWRWMYALFPDPEWSLQLMPFVCGIAAIPLMALVAWRLTGDTAVALVAGAVTSLVQLLAHYTVFVHQYTLEAVITALFLLAATRLVRDGDRGRPAAVPARRAGRRHRHVLLGAGRLHHLPGREPWARCTPSERGFSAGSRCEASSGARRRTTAWWAPRGGCSEAGRTPESADGSPKDSCRSIRWMRPGPFWPNRAAAC